VAGKFGKALEFDGNENHVETPPAAALEQVGVGSYTLTAWYRAAETPKAVGEQHALVVRPGRHTGLAYRADGRVQMHVWGQEGYASPTSRRFGPGEFRHVVGVVDISAGNAAVYIDGAAHETARLPENWRAHLLGKVWRIGIGVPGHPSVRWAAKGLIDDVRIYSRALSPAELEALYKLGEARAADGK
jgi:hypothetical protein